MHNNQIRQLRKYGITTAFVSFILSGTALACLVWAFISFDQVPVIQNVISNWHHAPIVNIITVPVQNSCPQDYQLMTTTEWPGTLSYCQCYQKNKVVNTTKGECKGGEGSVCGTILGAQPHILQILKSKKFCLKREEQPVDYSRLQHADLKTGKCPQDTRVCGTGNSICYPAQLQCPINHISLKSSIRLLIDGDQAAQIDEQSQEENEGQENQEGNQTQDQAQQGSAQQTKKQQEQIEESPQQKSQNQSEKNQTTEPKSKTNQEQVHTRVQFDQHQQIVITNTGFGTPIVQFQWGYGHICLNPDYYSNVNIRNQVRTDYFWLLDLSHMGCPEISEQLGSKDTRWQRLLDQDEQGLFNQNGINNSYRDMPGNPYLQPDTDFSQPKPTQTLFYRRYSDWRDECWNDEIRRPHRLEDQSMSLRNIHFQILTLIIMAGAVFIIVGLIYPLLTCCCHCCGNQSINSYKLFLASKGVASIILVGGFTVLMMFFIQKPYQFNSNFKNAVCSDALTNKIIQQSDKSVDEAFMFESISFISLSVLLVIEIVMAVYYLCMKD